MELRLPFQLPRERELWTRLLAAQPGLAAYTDRAERALAAGASPLTVLDEQVDPAAYRAALGGWAPAPLPWEGYAVGAEAGRGAHGVVYWARWRDQDVALKLLGALADPRRFAREAEVLARLDHPHVVRLLERGEVAGVPYLTTPALRGGSLAAAGAQPPTRALDLALQVGAALAHAHAAGVTHRDLKPENVLLDAAGQAHVLDFGLARGAGTSLTGSRLALGSIAYAAPEQLGDAKRAGPAADVFALGALLHFLLAGAPPWPEARTLAQRVRRIQAGALALPAGVALAPPARRALEALLALALRRDPAERIALGPLTDALRDCRARL